MFYVGDRVVLTRDLSYYNSIANSWDFIRSGAVGEISSAHAQSTYNVSFVTNDGPVEVLVNETWLSYGTQDNPKSTEEPSKPDPKNCFHDWVFYRGLNWDYYFCVKCDAKKDI